MKRFLKYLIMSIVIVAFCEASGASDAVSLQIDPFSGSSIESIEPTSFISEPENELCLPRQVSFAAPARLKSTTRRTDNVQRQNFEFVKSGSVIRPSVRYLVQQFSIASCSSLSDASSRVVRLGRLVI